MNALGLAWAAAGFWTLPASAIAHPAWPGAGGFTGGLLHPLFVPSHLIATVALGVLIGLQPRWGRAAVACFVAGLAAGAVAIALAYAPTRAEEGLLAATVVSGLLIVLAREYPRAIGSVLALATGFALTLDSPPDAVSLRAANLTLAGTIGGAGALLLLACESTRRLNQSWQRIATRIAGSWIAASAILVLALRLLR